MFRVIIKFTLGGIAFVSLIVGALGIVNTMYVIVTEKKKEIGIMKSVGARNHDILFIFVFQAGFFGLLGAILGVFFGSFAAIGFGAVAQSSGFTFLKITIIPGKIIIQLQ
jgi:ABC-type antimicrobial peptide transport system permease subunit